MIPRSSTITIILISALLLFTTTSCDDDSVSGVNNDDIPTIPNFVHAFMADEIFTEEESELSTRESITGSRDEYLERVHSRMDTGTLYPGTKPRFSEWLQDDNDDLSNFETAGELINEIRLSLQSVQFLFYQLFIPVNQSSPSVADDMFIWEFEMPVTDSEIVLDTRIMAKPAESNDNHDWTIDIKGLYLDDTSIEVRVLDAVSSFDGSTGTAEVNMPVLMGGEIYQSNLTWDVESSLFMDMSFDFEFDDEDADQILTNADYTFDAEESVAILSDAWIFIDNEVDTRFESQWDPEKFNGSVTIDGEEYCWDEDFQDSACE